jgi:hypothetical protein
MAETRWPEGLGTEAGHPRWRLDLRHQELGYVQYLDVATLEAVAVRAGGVIYVTHLSGSFADCCGPFGSSQCIARW